jgi:hypothetical protein
MGFGFTASGLGTGPISFLTNLMSWLRAHYFKRVKLLAVTGKLDRS